VIYVLLLRATLGFAIVGQFDSEKDCAETADRYMMMLIEQRSDDRHDVKMNCVGIPARMPEPSTTKEA